MFSFGLPARSIWQTYCSSAVSIFIPSSSCFLIFFFATVSMVSCKFWKHNWVRTWTAEMSLVLLSVHSDLQCGELVLLTSFEALMNGCHCVGHLLPEVQQCCLKQHNKEYIYLCYWKQPRHDRYNHKSVTVWSLCSTMYTVPGMWLKRETGGCSDWPPAGPPSGRRHSSVCQSWFLWCVPGLEPEICLILKRVIIAQIRASNPSLDLLSDSVDCGSLVFADL